MASIVEFVEEDAVNQGNWIGIYGDEGYSIANSAESLSGATFEETGLNFTWEENSGAPRSVETPSGGRIASAWYDGDPFFVDIRFPDNRPRQVAVYCIDWDSTTRRQVVDAYPWNTGDVSPSSTPDATWTLDYSFNSGVWGIFNVTEGVRLRFTKTANQGLVSSVMWSLATPEIGGSRLILLQLLSARRRMQGAL